MQLSTLVLPAPFGPISANNSPAATDERHVVEHGQPAEAQTTDRSIVELSHTTSAMRRYCLTSRYERRSPAGLAKIELLDVLVAREPLAVAVEHDAAVLHHIAHSRRSSSAAAALCSTSRIAMPSSSPDREQTPRQILHDDGREAERQLVDQQQLGRHISARGDRQHLPLAARQQPGRSAGAARQGAESS